MGDFVSECWGLCRCYLLMLIMAATCAALMVLAEYVHWSFIALMLFAPPFWMRCAGFLRL